METIRNYLETMFRNMPNTPEVRRAKDELWQMMEDKYASLADEGLPENEAIANVISEFGNLDDLSEVLDIQRYLPARIENEKKAGRELGLLDARAYIRDDRLAVILLAFGVFLCIVSFCGPVLLQGIGEALGMPSLERLGVAIFLLLVAAGVWTIIYSGTPGKKWRFIKNEPCSIDFASAAYLDDMINTQAPQLSFIRGLGIVLCILSVVPGIAFSDIHTVSALSGFFESIGITLFFIMVGAGVMLIIFSSFYNRAARRLLRLNSIDTIGGNYAGSQGHKAQAPRREAYKEYSLNKGDGYARAAEGQARWEVSGEKAMQGSARWDARGDRAARSKARREADKALYESGSRAGFILSVYWQTVTCLYLSASFLTFSWGTTWLIWPVAWLIEKVIRMNAEG